MKDILYGALVALVMCALTLALVGFLQIASVPTRSLERYSAFVGAAVCGAGIYGLARRIKL